MQHICTETHDFDLTKNIVATPDDETNWNRSDRPSWRSDRHSLTGLTAAKAGQTASPGLRKILSLENRNPLEFSNQ